MTYEAERPEPGRKPETPGVSPVNDAPEKRSPAVHPEIQREVLDEMNEEDAKIGYRSRKIEEIIRNRDTHTPKYIQ